MLSQMLSQMTKDLWLWCMERNILIHAQHLLGVLNTTADRESRTWSDRSEWKLSPAIFYRINLQLGPLSTDLFASRLSFQLTTFVSWKPDLSAIATDAFTLDWSTMQGKLFVNPPWNMIGRILSQVHQQSVQELAQALYPTLLQMLVRVPLLIPQSPETIQSVCQDNLPDIIPQLAVWVISGRDAITTSFQSQLQTMSYISSWRDKSSKSYNSSFGKWVR